MEENDSVGDFGHKFMCECNVPDQNPLGKPFLTFFAYLKISRSVIAAIFLDVLKKLYQKITDVANINIIFFTPPRPSEISEKNWSTWAKPFLTSHLCYKDMLKV